MKEMRFPAIIKTAVSAVFLIFGMFGQAYASTSAMPVPVAKNKTAKQKNMNNTKSSFSNPDFAFPETVEKDAAPVLEKALRDADGLRAIEAAMQVITARNLISESSFNENVALLDSMSKVLPQPYSSLSLLIEARIYRQMFQQDRWNYSQRTLPLDSYPEDVKSWSQDLFAKKILELIDAACKENSEALRMPISDIASILDNVGEAEKSGLSVWDFMVYNSVSDLEAFSSRNLESVIPFRKDGGVVAKTISEKCGAKSIELIDGLLSYREKAGSEAPLVVAVMQKADFMPREERKEFLKKWAIRLYGSHGDGRLLHQYFLNIDLARNYGSSEMKEIYGMMKEWIEKNPQSRFLSLVKFDLSRAGERKAMLSLPSNAIPGIPVKGNMSLDNLNEAYVLLYKVPESMIKNGGVNFSKLMGTSKLVKSIPVRVEGEVPFSGKSAFELPALEPGNYVAIPSSTPQLSSKWRKEVELWSLAKISVSDIAAILSGDRRNGNASRVYVVDARTQQPVEGAVVKIYNQQGSRLLRTVTTDADGACDLKNDDSQLKITKGTSTIWQSANFYTYGREEEENCYANILTDLSVYKPGETVRFSLVGWTRNGHVNRLLKVKDVSVVMKDANWNDVDTLNLTTDENGRCQGSFTLPKTGLLGSFTLVADFKDFKNRNAGSQSFQVAEYKAPGFLVTVDSDKTSGYEAGDLLKFRGVVATYSGMPLGNAAVSYKITWQPWWRWYSGGGNASYGGETATNADGTFLIELPTENLKNTRFERGIYTLEVWATSPSGETQSSKELRFSIGEGFNVNPLIGEKTEVKGDTVSFNVPVFDMLDHPVSKDVDYEIVDLGTGKKVYDGQFMSPRLKLASSLLPSSKYKFSFHLAGDTAVVDAETVIFRVDDKKAPYATPLWVPEDRIVVKDDQNTVNVKVGSGYTDEWILCEISDEKGFSERKWIKPSDGMTNIKVIAPASDTRRWVRFSGLHDLDQNTAEVVLIPACQERNLKVEANSFRDKISAGDKEKWQFRFTIDGVPQKGIPSMAVMSNKALNAIAPFEWTFNAGGGYWRNDTWLSYRNTQMSRTMGSFSVLPKYPSVVSPIPEWNTFGFGFTYNGRNSHRVFIRGKSSRSNTEEVLNTVMVTEAPLMMAAVNASGVAAKEMKLEAADEEESQDMASAFDGAAGGAAISPEKPRPVEMPLAFFMPDLKSDADGNVNVEFETPDFNTTWQFQIVGYTDDLLTARLVKDAVASKPVMVQSNLPRYLRTGDKATITALLFNNSGETSHVHGEIIIANALTGETIQSIHAGAEPLEASGSRKISLEFDVPSDLSALKVTAYAYGGNFSDGEQDIIPVLPSSTPVVESTQFYMGTGKKSFETRLPKFRKDANLTFRYCDNPVWECVLALPSVANADSKNILSLMRALYANSLALDVAQKYPAVRKGLESVFSAKADGDSSLLVSNLQKDAALKTVALDNTPWVNNASAETARMQSLSSLLDTQTGKEIVGNLMNEISQLQNADGGWSWCPDMKSSLFMTQQALLHFGMMRHIGCLPSGWEKMVKKAISYSDREVVKDYERSKREFSTISMLDYLYIRSFFDVSDGNGTFRSLKAKALKRISEEWRDMSIYNKATAATLLARSSGYERTAPVILESLRQLASKDEAKGWWYDNLRSGWTGWEKLITTAQVLEAYAGIEPASPAVDGLRRWLVLQKETEDWGGNSYTVEVIQSILSCGSDWTSSPEKPVVKLGGKRLELPETALLTGQFSMQLDPKEASGKKLEVEKTSQGPSWGGVVSQYVAPIADVRSADCENLKIEKALFKVSDTEAGESVRSTDLKVGDKVRVTFTVTCGKDMNYVALIDERAACLEPDDQLSGYTVKDGLGMYREVRDTKTSFFIDFLPKGVNVISYDCHVTREGVYALGIASAQSQYSPLQSAHSAGEVLSVEGNN